MFGVLAWVFVLLVVASPAAAPVSGAEPVERTAARLDDLMRRITGSVEERRAAELLNYHRVEGGLAACMRAAGRPYRQPPYVSYYQDYTDADLGYGNGSGTVLDSVTAGPRPYRLAAAAFERLRRSGAVEHALAPEDVPAFEACNAPFGHRSYFDADPPAGVRELSGLDGLFAPLAADGAVAAAMRPYQSCMRSKGHPDVGDDRPEYLSTRPAGQIEAAFAADAACRRPAYELAMARVAPALEAWEAGHRAELVAVRQAWRRLVADATPLPR